jgi:hypothetical protein
MKFPLSVTTGPAMDQEWRGVQQRSTKLTFLHGHSKGRFWWFKDMVKILQHFCIREGYDFDRHALRKLLGSALVCRNKFCTNICSQELHIFPVVCNENKSANSKLQLRWEKLWFHGRCGCFCEDFLSQVTCSSTFHAVQGVVYPLGKSESLLGVQNRITYSSAPSIVTLIVGYWSTSPSLKPLSTISCFDWNPKEMMIKMIITRKLLLTSRNKDSCFI